MYYLTVSLGQGHGRGFAGSWAQGLKAASRGASPLFLSEAPFVLSSSLRLLAEFSSSRV